MAKNNDKQFTITLNECQLRLLAYACRVTDRLIIGQLNFSLQECCEAAFEKLYKGKDAGEIGSDEWYTMRFEVEEAMRRNWQSARWAKNREKMIRYGQTHVKSEYKAKNK